MNKIGILFTTRNNYSMLDNWLNNINYEECPVLNIDENSTEEEKKKRKRNKR